jgi:serine/threonine-protein kinase
MNAEDTAASARPAEVRECLDRVLASPYFASRRRGELLRYLVDRTLAGEADSIGEYAIALDVFRKPDSFDPRSESTIRAEMSRLRKGLADYYAAEGAADPWRFEFPARGYVPSWSQIEVAPTPAPVRSPARFRIRIAAALLLASSAAAIAWRLNTASAPIRSLVVLPFANLTGDPANDSVADGITEGLTDSLARVASLRVVARTSAFQFRGKARDIREIGRQVNADAVVEGSIRRTGDHLAVTVQVNRSADGFHVLSRVFEGRPADLVRIEHDLAAPVLAVLRPGIAAPGGRVPDPEAWALVLKARALRGAVTLDSFRQAVTLLNEAIRRDPEYAGAWEELATEYAAASVNLHVDEATAANMAKSAAHRALELDPASAAAWSSQGFVDAMVFLNWKSGEDELRRALALAPQDALIHQRLSNLLLLNGEFPEALKEGRIAEQLDPLVANAGMSVGMVYFMERRYDLALAQWMRISALHPDVVLIHNYIGSALEAQGKYEQAMKEYQVVWTRHPEITEARIVHLLVSEGRVAEARQRLAKYAPSSDADPFSLAVIYGALGDHERAFAYLEDAWRHHNCWMLKVYPFLDPLRSDPRYATFLKRAGFEK